MAQQKLTVDAVIDAITKTRGMITIAADMLKCSPQTLYNYMEKYPTVKAARENARERMLDTAELSLFQAISKGEMSAIIFYLKTQGKQRGYVERLEIDVRYVALIKQIETLAGAHGLTAGDVFNDIIAEFSAAGSEQPLTLPENGRETGGA